jgi:flavin-dependent thymidylate synthase
MKVGLLNYTENALELLIFAKNTRLVGNISGYDDVCNMTREGKLDEAKKIFSTIPSSWEFVDYTFLLQDVTRAFTHELVRTRVGVSFAQQSQRFVNMDNFGYLIPDKIMKEDRTKIWFKYAAEVAKEAYGKLLDMGVDRQDARGILPTNVYTNILMKINLSALSTMLETRLCYRSLGEYQKVAREMRDLVLSVHDWAEPVLAPFCLKHWRCKFPLFDRCPLKAKYESMLSQPHDDVKNEMKKSWSDIVVSVQPK